MTLITYICKTCSTHKILTKKLAFNCGYLEIVIKIENYKQISIIKN